MTKKKTLPHSLETRNEELKKLTFECVTESLFTLMRNCSYEEISVTAICEKAGISRNTFYKRFGTKDNVFKSIVDNINKNVIYRNLGNPFNASVSKDWYVRFFEIVKEHVEWFRMIIRSGLTATYMEKLNAILLSGAVSAETSYVRLMWSGAMQNVTVKWIEDGLAQSPEEIARICCGLLNID